MTQEEKLAYRQAIEPLAKFLAKKPINDEIHQYVVADVYDIVNDIRDNLVKEGKSIIWKLQSSPDFYTNAEKRTKVLNIQRVIRTLQGATQDGQEPMQGSVQDQPKG